MELRKGDWVWIRNNTVGKVVRVWSILGSDDEVDVEVDSGNIITYPIKTLRKVEEPISLETDTDIPYDVTILNWLENRWQEQS